jgi:hypothetical protein
MFLYDGTAFFDIFGNNSAAVWDHTGMTNDIILKDRNIGCTTTNVNNGHTGFFLFFCKDSF